MNQANDARDKATPRPCSCVKGKGPCRECLREGLLKLKSHFENPAVQAGIKRAFDQFDADHARAVLKGWE